MITESPHFSPICETWNPAISDKYFVSPPAGEFESVNVVGSIFGGKTANNYLRVSERTQDRLALLYYLTLIPIDSNVSAVSILMRFVPSGPRNLRSMMATFGLACAEM